jgi:hypothetical protein
MALLLLLLLLLPLLLLLLLLLICPLLHLLFNDQVVTSVDVSMCCE